MVGLDWRCVMFFSHSGMRLLFNIIFLLFVALFDTHSILYVS